MEIHLIFNASNQLKISITSNPNQSLDLKICFSLVYSIENIDGGTILKKIGRYYEVSPEKNEIILTLQNPRINSYNLSCGPEGLFIIDSKEKRLECVIHTLKFETPIPLVKYTDDQEKILNPVIPIPFLSQLKNEFLNISNLQFKIKEKEKDFFNKIKNITEPSNIIFNTTAGCEILFLKKKLQVDEYKILIDKKLITIHFSDYGGKLYSIVTLVQLVNFYKSELPLGLIEDKPSLSWRGMHLDCARQFYSIERIKRLMDYMCFFKLNRFHWHLTDNEAWRVELECYPNLTNQGAFRGYNEKIPPFYGTGYDKSGGYYSRSEIKDLIEYANQRNIEIMPEIDLPAHSWTLLEIMPELRDTSSNVISEDVGNYPNNTINPALEETHNFLKNILEELSEIFSFNIIHINIL